MHIANGASQIELSVTVAVCRIRRILIDDLNQWSGHLTFPEMVPNLTGSLALEKSVGRFTLMRISNAGRWNQESGAKCGIDPFVVLSACGPVVALACIWYIPLALSQMPKPHDD